MKNKKCPEEFHCANCHEIFLKGQTDKEAEEEYKLNFPNEEFGKDDEVVCDDCYKEIMKWYNENRM